MRVAIVGAGAIARAHARALRYLSTGTMGSRFTLQAVASKSFADAADLASQFGIAEVLSVDDALRSNAVDAVIITSPTPLHAEQAQTALSSGKHVLCEIPLALSSAQSELLTALAEERAKTLMVCHTMRYQAPIQRLRQRIRDGSLTPLSLVARFAFLRRDDVGATGLAREWSDNLLWHHGCHLVDLALWLFNETSTEVTEVAAGAAKSERPMDLGILLRTERGRLASLFLSYNSHHSMLDLVLIGEEDTVRVDDAAILRQWDMLGHESTHPITIQDGEFLRAVLDGVKPLADVSDVRATMRALQSAEDLLVLPERLK